MSAFLQAIDRRVGGKLAWLAQAIGNGYCTAKAIAKGDVTLEVHQVTEEERKQKASALLARQLDGLSEEQLKSLQAEAHRRLNRR